jgi:hypothetical protein
MTDRSGQIDEVSHRLKRHYIFPEVAAQVTAFLQGRLAAGAYDGLDDESFAPISPRTCSRSTATNTSGCATTRPGAGQRRRGLRPGRLPRRSGAERVRHHPTLLAKTDALIIDVRRNGGGDPDTVALLCTYLFDEEKHLNDIYFREGDRTCSNSIARRPSVNPPRAARTREGSTRSTRISTSRCLRSPPRPRECLAVF